METVRIALKGKKGMETVIIVLKGKKAWKLVLCLAHSLHTARKLNMENNTEKKE
jgi:hypothetical protein